MVQPTTICKVWSVVITMAMMLGTLILLALTP